jgi:adenosine deaminase
VRVLEDEAVTALAKERETVFEVCVTSNYQSGVVSSLPEHPLPRMFEAGLKVTVNTDDPSVSRITLAHEYQHISEDLRVPMDTLKNSVLVAAQAAFLPDVEKEKLVASLKKELKL